MYKKISLIFVSNYINHHQVWLADELASSPEIDYYFIETTSVPEFRVNLGYPSYSDRKYVIQSYKNDLEMARSRNMIDNADVVIIGSAPDEWVKKRIKENKITFHYSERWFKQGYASLLSPRAWWYLYKNHIRFRNKRSYMLCASAYTAPDVHKVFAYPKKCFKWGYFTKTPTFNLEIILETHRDASRLRILWVARFLDWKHPELPVKLAKELKLRNIDFELNMYGSGQELESTNKLIHELDVSDRVILCGTRPNDEILSIMREHDIFLFTSDRNEGWGAVVNEAMSNGCAVIASDAIGSVPFLIQDGVNGMIYQDQNLQSLLEKTLLMLDDNSRDSIRINAYKTLHDIWSPKNAAENFIKLAKSAMNGDIIPAKEGPCSKA